MGSEMCIRDRLIGEGTREEMLTNERVSDLFEISIEIEEADTRFIATVVVE